MKQNYSYNLCKGTTQHLIDCANAPSWQKAKSIFKSRGYTGAYILHQENPKTRAFRLININL